MHQKLILRFTTLLLIAAILSDGLVSHAAPLPPLRRVNAPWFGGPVQYEQTAVFWLGKVTPTENYADVRVGYNNTELFVSVTIFDRRLWYDENPTPATLTNYDAVSLFLDKTGNSGTAPDANSYQLVGQVNWWEPRADWQAAWQGNGTQWIISTIAFTTTTGFKWESATVGGFNNDQNNRGWVINYHIPFTSLGLSDPPPQGSLWGLGVVVHDRDTGIGPMSPLETWPENFVDTQPGTWGQLRFGVPAYTPQPAVATGNTIIRQGLNGVTVPDAAVGGTINNMCPGNSDYIWNQWANFSDPHNMQFNVQNQGDVSDWPCFAKYFVSFPLNTVPAGKVIISATLTLHQFGNAGQGWSPPPVPSYIQVLTLGQSWNENTLTWNTAPLARENASGAWVDPLPGYGGDPGVPRTWDVSRAVAESYSAGEPLYLALYSADWAYQSGRYFWSSDHDEYPAEARPTLNVYWGDAMGKIEKTVRPAAALQGQAVTYRLTVVGSGRTLTVTDNLPTLVSPPGPINVSGGGNAAYQAGTHRVVWSGSVAAGQVVTISFPVTIATSLPLAIVNQASLSDTVLGNSTAEAVVIANGQSVFLPLELKQ
jgi:hypothetical protein